MKLSKSDVLFLSIAEGIVYGLAHKIRSAKIVQSEILSIENSNTEYAIKEILDELEKKINTRFEFAYVVSNIENNIFYKKKCLYKNILHKINSNDIKKQIDHLLIKNEEDNPDYLPIHIIPIKYTTDNNKNLKSPIGIDDYNLSSIFSVIAYNKPDLQKIYSYLYHSKLEPEVILDGSFVIAQKYRKQEDVCLIVNLENYFTNLSIWKETGPVFFKTVKFGKNFVIEKILNTLNINFEDAYLMEKEIINLSIEENDRYFPVSDKFDFTKEELKKIILSAYRELLSIFENEISECLKKHNVNKIFISGSNRKYIKTIFNDWFNINSVNLGTEATIKSLSEYVFKNEIKSFLRYINKKNRRDKLFSSVFKFFSKKQKNFLNPIILNIKDFDLIDNSKLDLFKSLNLSFFYTTIMDGFFVNRIYGNIQEIEYIKSKISGYFYVHLMMINPNTLIKQLSKIGVDGIIIPLEINNLYNILNKIKKLGKKVGISIEPSTKILLIKPFLKMIDDVFIMSSNSGAEIETFNKDIVNKIIILVNTRRKYDLKFNIIVCGDITEEYSKICWNAGADFIVCSSSIYKSNDLSMTIQNLLSK